MTTEIYIVGEISNSQYTEWFGGFNYFLVEKYLKHQYDVFAISYKRQNWKLIYSIPNTNHELKINANSLFIINVKTLKTIGFTTVDNLKMLYEDNKDFFDDHLETLYSGTYNSNVLKYEWPEICKVCPWYYRPLHWQMKQSSWNPTINKLYFRGLYISGSRDFINILSLINIDDIDVSTTKVSKEDYFYQCSNSLISLSAPGARDMCHRDIEFLMNGIPMIRPRFSSKLIVDIPDEIYIPIDHDILEQVSYIAGLPANHDTLAQKVIEKWHDVKQDFEFIQSISENAKEFYSLNFTPDRIADHILEALKNSGHFEPNSISVSNQFNNMDTNLTIVSGLWNINREGRDFSIYEEHFDKFLRIPAPMVLFVPQELEEFVWLRRSKHNTFVKIYELADIREIMFQPFWDKWQSIRTDPDWNSQAGWLSQSPQAKDEFYNPIVMSKMFFLHDAKIWNHFETDYFIWLDAGITQTCYENYFYETENLRKLTQHIDPFLFLSYPYHAEKEIHGFEYPRINDYAQNQVKYVCRGGLFGGHKDFLSQANSEYYHLLDRTLNDGLGGTEESIFTILSYHSPENYRRFELDPNGLIVKFLQKLTENAVQLVEVVKKRNKLKNYRNLWDIKTNLYFLTFNFPDQLEYTINSLRTHSNFLTHPSEKYVIDNSTDVAAIKRNADICVEHGFTHLIQNKNTGINGGRLIAAEHFEQSDSDYYLFFEDDMTISDDTELICRNGFRKYVPDLYSVIHKIMEMEEFDFLKLSFTEVYMDNHIQCSWYNVPQEIRTREWPDYDRLPISGFDAHCPRTKFDRIGSIDGVAYISGNVYYANWPHITSKEGNRKMFLTKKWDHPFEQTWMSYIYQQTVVQNISCGVLLASPVTHDRFAHYNRADRREN